MSEAIIVVTRAVVARPDTLQALLTASLEHVHRSHLELGCLSHAVSIDAENALRLTFLEHWADLPSLALHLASTRFYGVFDGYTQPGCKIGRHADLCRSAYRSGGDFGNRLRRHEVASQFDTSVDFSNAAYPILSCGISHSCTVHSSKCKPQQVRLCHQCFGMAPC